MAADAERTLGGRFYAQVGDRRFEIIGECVIEPAGESREGHATSGGQAYVTTTPEPARAKCKFTNSIRGGNPIALFNLRDGINITFVEPNRKIRHLFTDASAVGKPSLNLQNGECDGIEIITDKYQRTVQ